jgi:glyoxylase-like metal-dependent hydrolase (beta-lactamase superfamily II)
MEVLPGVHWVEGIRGGNVFLLEEPQSLTLVDAGLPGSHDRILRFIQSLGRESKDLKAVVITHGHIDHLGSAAALRRRTGAQVWAHAAEVTRDAEGNPLVTQWSNPGPLRRWLSPRLTADRLLEDGEVLPVLGGLQVLHTPGHTPGSICLLLERHQALFTGDMLLSNGQRLSRSFFFPGANPQDYWQSLRRLAALEFQAVLTGHGPPCLQEGPQRLRTLLDLYSTAKPGWWRAIRNIPGLMKFGRAFMERRR